MRSQTQPSPPCRSEGAFEPAERPTDVKWPPRPGEASSFPEHEAPTNHRWPPLDEPAPRFTDEEPRTSVY